MVLVRRDLLRSALGFGAGMAGFGLVSGAKPALSLEVAPADGLQACRPSGDPLQRLLAGNQRFAQVWQRAARSSSIAQRRQLFAQLALQDCFLDPTALDKGQKPWVALLACADSRVAPDLVFGVTPGEMFEVRSAGNTAFAAGIASLEYAVGLLKVPLIVVMGHSGCGAVTAAMGSEPLTPLLQDLVQPIKAAIPAGADLAQAIRANAVAAARQLPDRSAMLRQARDAGQLKIQPLYLDLGTGLVQVL